MVGYVSLGIQPLPLALSENERGAEQAGMDGSSCLRADAEGGHGGAWGRDLHARR